jgi:hypothetical protein
MTLAEGNTAPYENGFWLGLLFYGYEYADTYRDWSQGWQY